MSNIKPLTDSQIHQSIESVVKFGEAQCDLAKNDADIARAAFDLVHSLNTSKPDPNTINKKLARIKSMIAKRRKLPKLPNRL